MSTLSAGPPLNFDYDGAEELAAAFDAMAEHLEAHAGRRPGLANRARRPWEGQLRGEFDDRIRTCVEDGHRLAAAMREAALHLRTLIEDARAEDDRRSWARDYLRQQDELRWWQRTGKNVREFFFGRDEIPRPPGPSATDTHEVLVRVCPQR